MRIILDSGTIIASEPNDPAVWHSDNVLIRTNNRASNLADDLRLQGLVLAIGD